MLRKTTAALFVIVGLINVAPVVGLHGKSTLESAYAISITSPEMLLLIRHRAVFFGIVGGLLLVAAFRPESRGVAAVSGFISMFSFILMVMASESLAPEYIKLARIDSVGILALALACWGHWRLSRSA